MRRGGATQAPAGRPGQKDDGKDGMFNKCDRRRSRSDFSLSELLEIEYKHPCTSDVKERERTAIVNS